MSIEISHLNLYSTYERSLQPQLNLALGPKNRLNLARRGALALEAYRRTHAIFMTASARSGKTLNALIVARREDTLTPSG